MQAAILRAALVVLFSSGLAAACGGGAPPASASGTSGGGGASPLHALPPAPGPEHPPDGTGSVTFGIRKLHLGDATRDGTPDLKTGWMHFGFDLDGKISTADSTDLCKPLSGASPKNVGPDGDVGIDNSFGKNIRESAARTGAGLLDAPMSKVTSICGSPRGSTEDFSSCGTPSQDTSASCRSSRAARHGP